ncbi:TrmB family transcriptional regulator [Candidatus Borrarchaeum sp.]|uniref:TrmB family transcriptional regulator n=1 Tax=Candidatus Borrarchaeum sp. TaxID=2846742 RepID=UPI00257D1517|nr:helix-turn-helix domain-containing protein [Candidatus Borrarchaeum sp.]
MDSKSRITREQFSEKEEIIELLTAFGLTNNQAKIYEAIIKLGAASVDTISKLSDVRREDVYRNLPRLEEMGLVERLMGTPMTIRVLPIKFALSDVINREQEKAKKRIRKLKNNLQEALTVIKPRSQKQEFDEDAAHFALIPDKAVLYTKISGMLNAAKNEIDMAVSRSKIIEFLSSFHDLLKKAVESGVKVRIITEMTDSHEFIPKFLETAKNVGIEFKTCNPERLLSKYLLIDGKQMILATKPGKGHLGDHPDLWTDNQSLINHLKNDFEEIWKSFKIEPTRIKITSEP